jgi:hypothetical protein
VAGIPLDKRPKRSIGGAPVITDLSCEGECTVLPNLVRLLLRGGERRLRMAALDLEVGESGEADPIWSAVEEFARSSPKPAQRARVRAARTNPRRRTP